MKSMQYCFKEISEGFVSGTKRDILQEIVWGIPWKIFGGCRRKIVDGKQGRMCWSIHLSFFQ